MKPPTTMKKLKSFLGMVSYIQRFIPGLASITSTFTKLFKKEQGFEWGKVQQLLFLVSLFLGLRDTTDDIVPCNQSPSSTTYPFWKDISVVVIIVAI